MLRGPMRKVSRFIYRGLKQGPHTFNNATLTAAKKTKKNAEKTNKNRGTKTEKNRKNKKQKNKKNKKNKKITFLPRKKTFYIEDKTQLH